ncbi:unnamed protein product [Periconia digitata]|uniref:Uncharacterized protein n=1 Tax=Periconia digitata TaxID=1303443 RepID=A0A9W4U6U2_9PLEO|nr:unnamed protein product [Periconia digitata]
MPKWLTYTSPLTQAQVNTGLAMYYTMMAIIGDKGSSAFFVLLSMALTSTVSSSMAAVSSLLSFNVYTTYIKPRVSDNCLVKVSQVIALVLSCGGANMTWIGYFRLILSCLGIIARAHSALILPNSPCSRDSAYPRLIHRLLDLT